MAWLLAHPAPSGASVITSLPDVSETAQLSFEAWRSWFIGAAAAVTQWLPPGGLAIFFQSDIRHHGVWVDKGYLVLRAAEMTGASLVWHKIICRKPPGNISQGRSTYSHMLCLAKEPRPPSPRPGPDVLSDAGYMPWSRAMGLEACRLACNYLRSDGHTRLVVDPFCGQGSALAVANAYGFDAIGVDLSAKRCRVARSLSFAGDLASRSPPT